MRQTVKYARVRAIQDPDRDLDTPGTYYGNNAPGSFRLNNKRFARLVFTMRTTRGAHVAKGER
ncbi:hypothetical protein SEA_ANNADREAMY_254 [Streptomyces phage Annadreamy]|uniref:Uncharacterized protein n=2 Tax=Annadreamyvirus annadreamy TaxID=2846392 RepID=A0A345GTR1_9CAUD|nr:hypothetical protein HWB75_gp025 [Streptomyces phage Annadreamy]AXG66333.1 hypothetical protein SEA_ANNADREAMY_254 [Streptomyces phage Annadreamy]QGH79561.1 hypothetical protein SEA_LIMPID_260 [Streptomyces phage Limpid]